MKPRWDQIRANLGLWVLLAAFVAALLRVLTLQTAAVADNKKVVRMVHWQLEAGIAEAIQEVAQEYEKRHPDVRIEQILIGERGYATWVTTRLIGGTAPEIIEYGQVPPALLTQLLQRYFLPISDVILQPNPYNAGTELEGVPWKNTYNDDMSSAYHMDLLEYYAIPSSAFTVRLYYNKPLLKAATGLDVPPREFRAFLAACEQIKAYGRRTGLTLVPIAGAGKYNAPILFNRFEQVVGTTLLPEVDVNFDADASGEESAIAFLNGTVAFDDPRIRAMFRGREAYIEQFQPAFFPADRMDAAFLFIQQRAVMIASGSWDAASYAKQAPFEIGIVDFPLPARDDPEFGQFVLGPAVETLDGGFAFVINRTAPHAEEALDFMKFMTSQPMNDLLNRRIQWVPMIRGNAPAEFIAPFWPRIDGVKRGIWLDPGGYNWLKWNELLALHATGRAGFDEIIESYRATFVRNTDRWFRLDRARLARINQLQTEFRATAERGLAERGAGRPQKPRIILENLLARKYYDLEMTARYDAARAATRLPGGS